MSYKKYTHLLVLCLFFAAKSWAQPLNGTYTIGGSSPSYATITAATTALTTNGISGPVTFNIRTGIYNEKLVLTPVTGSSITNTITFQSETGNATNVTITDLHTTSAANYTVYINGADNIYIRNLTMEAQEDPSASTYYSKVVHIFNDGDNIHLENNIVKSYFRSFFSDYAYSAITSGHGGFTSGTFRDNDSLFVIGNTIIGGYHGVSIFGQSKVLTTYRMVANNTFTNQVEGGIYCNGFNQGYFRQNQIEQTSENISFKGIMTWDMEKTLQIDRNRIKVTKGKNGIDLYLVNATAGFTRVISNNSILLESATAVMNNEGISSLQSYQVLVAYNTIEINKPLSGFEHSCLRLGSGDTYTATNNIFLTRNGGYSYTSVGTVQLTSSNNNHFRQTTYPIANINSVSYTTLTDFQTATSQEINSFDANPFLIGTPAIIPGNLQLYGTGIPVAGITTDYYGTARSATAPCIGAYEGSPPANNAAVSYSNLPNLSICPEQNYPLKVRITNMGASTLTSAEIHFNGSVFNWTGSLATNQESADIDLGNWYVPRTLTHTLPPISVHFPNGQADQLTANDTLYVTLFPHLTGNYTVGGSTPDFNTITEASNRLTQNGICADVFINIAPGTYTEQTTFQNISGLSPTARLTIQSLNMDSTSVTCQYNITSLTANYVFQFKNLSYVTVRHLTLKPVANSGLKRVVFVDGGKYINVTNNRLPDGNFWVSSGTNPTGNIRFTNNNMSSTVDNSFIVATNGDNKVTIDGTFTNPIDSITVLGNVMTGPNTRELYINNTNHLSIAKNTMTGNTSQSPVDLDTCFIVNIYNNKASIQDNHYMLDLNKCTSPAVEQSLVYNNMLLGTGGIVTGIRLNGCSNLGIYFNTIKMPQFAILYGTGNSGIVAKNNILQSTSQQAVNYINSTVISAVTAQYNNIYGTGTAPISVSSANLTLTVFQQTYNNEFFSFVAAPTYVSGTDLHLATNSVPQDGTGTSIAGITQDIDGDPMASLIDVGADQFNLDYALFNFNIALVDIINPDQGICAGDNTLKIRVANVSDDVVNFFTVKWFLFNTQINSFVFNQVLNPEDTVDVTVGTYPFNTSTMYDVRFEISLPNNQTDLYFPDNAKSIAYYYTADFEIGSQQFDDCSTDTELYIPEFPRTSVLWSNGSTGSSTVVTAPGTYSVTVQFEGGCTLTRNITIN